MLRSHEERRYSKWASLLVYVLLLEGLSVVGWIRFLVGFLHGGGLVSRGMFPDNVFFTDFYTYKGTFANFHSQAFYESHPHLPTFAYPPVLAPVYELFYTVPHRTSLFVLWTFVVWAALVAWCWTLWNFRGRPGLEQVALAGSVLFVYPAIFLLQRGNLEIFVWAAVAVGLFFYTRRKPGWCAVALGTAAACKIYPVLLLGLLCYRRSFRFVFLGLATCICFTAGALLYAGPSLLVAAKGFTGGVSSFQQNYGVLLRAGELRYDHSLFAVVKVTAVDLGKDFRRYSRLYYGVAGSTFGLLYLLGARRCAWQNQVVFLSVCMILLPPVSYAYTIVHLYIPTLLVGGALLSGLQSTRIGAASVICLLALMLPIDMYPHARSYLAGQFQSVLLLTVAILANFPYFKQVARNSVDAGAAGNARRDVSLPPETVTSHSGVLS